MMDGWVSGGLCVLIALFVWARERFSGLFFIACFVEKLACFRRENHARPDALVCAAPRRADPSRGAGRHGRRTLVSRNVAWKYSPESRISCMPRLADSKLHLSGRVFFVSSSILAFGLSFSRHDYLRIRTVCSPSASSTFFILPLQPLAGGICNGGAIVHCVPYFTANMRG